MASKCNNSYTPNNPQELRFGILADRMICAGSYVDETDTCSVCFLFFIFVCYEF